MRLQFNPFQVFKSSKTPAGLYARQKWLGEKGAPGFEDDFQTTVRELLSGQSSGGLWGDSVIMTIQRLFGLHLTIREQTAPICKALNWLMGQILKSSFPPRKGGREHLTTRKLENLPFTPGHKGFLFTGATLFLATIFGFEQDRRVLAAYDWLNLEGVREDGRWGGWSSTNNILRAFIVHPEFSVSEATRLAVDVLARVQSPSGMWAEGIPFYQMVNTLAHLSLAHGDAQLEIAFKRLYETQHRDGTWGRSQREWNTFLVVHAFKNKGEL